MRDVAICGRPIGRRLAIESQSRGYRGKREERENLDRAGCSKRPSSKAATSEDARRTLRYVELLSEARTPLADFFSILLLLNARLAL
jgi:hypothetical protein